MARIYISGGGGGGTASSDVTATKSQVLEGVTALTSDSDDEPATGTLLKSNILASAGGAITSKDAATYTPGTANQTIETGQYLSGIQTIQGDSNLISANIAYGKSIFGIAGSLYRTSLGRTGSMTYSSATRKDLKQTGSTATDNCWIYRISNLGFTPRCYLGFVDRYYSGEFYVRIFLKMLDGIVYVYWWRGQYSFTYSENSSLVSCTSSALDIIFGDMTLPETSYSSTRINYFRVDIFG